MMSDPRIIYLGPACQKYGDGREWCEDDAWSECECGCSSVRYMLESDAQSELAFLQEENERLKIESFEVLYNAAIDERDALREKLTKIRVAAANVTVEGDMLQQRLTACEQRNFELIEMLRYALPAVKYESHRGDAIGANYQILEDRIEAAIKPTESGASE